MPFDSDGYKAKRLDTRINDMFARAETAFGVTLDKSPDEVFYHIFSNTGIAVQELDELAQAMYDGFNPDNADGNTLDNILAVSGLIRREASKAANDEPTDVVVTGTAGTVIPVGTLVGMSSNADGVFVVQDQVTIPVGGTTNINVLAETAGALDVPIGTLDLIIDPIAGWDTVTNAAELVPGTDRESDEAARLRRELSLQVTGAGTDGAIRAKVLAIASVESARVKSNRTLVTDADGIPGKAFLTVVSPSTADSQAIVDAIGETMPAGIEPYGTSSGTWVDPEGFPQTVGWSFASELNIFVTATIDKATVYPTDGNAQVAAAILAYFDGVDPNTIVTQQESDLFDAVGDGLSVNEAVRVLKLSVAIDTVPGVLGVSLALGIGAPSGAIDIPVAVDEIAVSLATPNIVVI